MSHQRLITILSNLGLKPNEAAVYLATLELGYAAALSLARKTDIKRGTVYEIIDRLLDYGMLKVTRREGKRYLVAEDPRVLTTRFNEHATSLSKHLPELLALQTQNDIKPRVTYFQGQDEIWQIYEDTLEEPQSIDSFTSVIDLYNLLDPKRIENYIRRRTEKGIPIRIIALDSPESRLWAERSQSDLREIRLIPREQYNFAADVEIYSNKVAIVSFKKHLFGLIIENEQIAQMHRAAFELMWQGAKSTGKS